MRRAPRCEDRRHLPLEQGRCASWRSYLSTSFQITMLCPSRQVPEWETDIPERSAIEHTRNSGREGL